MAEPPRWAREGRVVATRETLELRVNGAAPVRLLFVERAARLFVVPTGPGAGWWVALLRAGGGEITRPGGRVERVASALVTDEAAATEIRRALRRKYGEEAWRRYFPGTVRVIELDPARSPLPRSPGELARDEFDAIAPAYDAGVATKSFERHLKVRTAQIFTATLARGAPLLEIGPGTGQHTLPMLALGHRVVAVDPSEGMLAQLVRRAKAEGLEAGLTVRVASLGELVPALEEFPERSFGGAFSAFGAFNLEESVASVGPTLARWIRPGGHVVFTVLGRPGWVALAWELGMGRPRAGFARLNSVVPAGAIRYPLDLYLRTPSEWDHVLRPMFRRTRVEAVSTLTPPFESEKVARAMGASGRARAIQVDDWLNRRTSLAPLAEWVALTYERVEVGPT
jgi:ubiquinone/menaquinone biosynthesis C-methylase UbiE